MLTIGTRVRIIGEDRGHLGQLKNRTGAVVEISSQGNMYSVRIDTCPSIFCISRNGCHCHAFYAQEVVKENVSGIIKII